MLFGVVLGLSGFFKTRESGKAVIDDFPFRLCYGFTCGILFLSTALIGLQDLVGKNIDCYKASDAVNQYCWVTGTHLLVKSDNYRNLGNYYYGEERCERRDGRWVTKDGEQCVKTHSYYQWVPYILMLQGLIFFIPRSFWLRYEEGKMSSVSDGIRIGSSGSFKGETLKNVAYNVANYINLKEAGHFSYGWAYVTAQIMNLLCVIFAFTFTNHVLDDQFKDLGFRWIKALSDSNIDSKMLLYKTFPRMTKCEFQNVGRGGDLEITDYLCILAPNIISEKIFTFLWFWYVILGFILAINVLLVLLMACKSFNIRSRFMMRAVFSRKLHRHMSADDRLRLQLERMDFGKFLFLYLLGRNVEYFVYKRILEIVTDANDINEDIANAPPLHPGPERVNYLSRELSQPGIEDESEQEMYNTKYRKNSVPSIGLPMYPIVPESQRSRVSSKADSAGTPKDGSDVDDLPNGRKFFVESPTTKKPTRENCFYEMNF